MIASAIRRGLSVVLALSLLGLASASAASADIYSTPATGTHGHVNLAIPANITALNGLLPVPVKATLIAYTSKDASGATVNDVGTLLEPLVSIGPKRLISYQEAEDSAYMACSPSVTLQNGQNGELDALGLLLSEGWDVMVPDYEGVKSEFGSGAQAGQAILDGILAAESVGTGLSTTTEVGIMGYSGGGFATDWAAELDATHYAPSIDLVGIAMGGVPSDFQGTANALGTGSAIGTGFDLTLLKSMSNVYPGDINVTTPGVLLNAAGVAAENQIALPGNQCPFQYSALFAFQPITNFTADGAPPLSDTVNHPAIEADFKAQNLGVNPARTPTAPMFIWHAFLDELVPYQYEVNLVHEYCTLHGATVDFQTVWVGEHTTAGTSELPFAVGYLADRFNGVPATDQNCT